MIAFRLQWTEEAVNTSQQLKAAAQSSLLNRTKAERAKASAVEGHFKQVEKCVRLPLQNPKHPSLNTHEYDSIESPSDKKKKVFEAHVQNRTPGAYRLFWCYGPGKGEITLITITPHP